MSCWCMIITMIMMDSMGLQEKEGKVDIEG